MKKNVLVTGCSGGIGAKTSELFNLAEWNVTGTDIVKPGHEYCHQFYELDCSDEGGVQKLAQQLQSDLHAIVNNAAIQIEKDLIETSLGEWNNVMGVNVTSIFLLAKHLSPAICDGASIVNISSVHARATSKGLASYAASKGAVSALTRAMAIELGPRRIRVNAVLPGAIDTPMLTRGLNRGGEPEVAEARLISGSILKQVGSPVDVARLVMFLCDPGLSGNITGQEFVCDSGVLSRLASE
ncbi:MAG: short-chain dehydrogenase [Gammaproteobacteria bacterium]|jgi:NAD(P)-dependent dehydrogenase (short-subunit alcohol dehydrogenase family)|nr:short-chain dehydrogenase [Gammaproteobacteria bacterium]|tara:strand:+ start:935 stop:1657 length:723 start_codon:yes stop_codon:yes gene_type:complete